MSKILNLIFIVILLSNCSSPAKITDEVPKHDHFTLESKFVNETRVINVWKTDNYEDGNKSYPVLYMPDGGIKEDFPHIANTIAKLIKEKKIPEIILVGIENTVRGRDLTGFSEVEADAKYCPLTDGAKDFRNFILKELVPHITKNYRTNEKKGIVGESLAGLFVMETFFQKADYFDIYIAFDPSLWWNNNYLVRSAKKSLEKSAFKDTRLWFAGSSVPDISTHTNALEKIMKEVVPKNLTWTYSDEPNEKHHTIFRATKEKALIWALAE